MTGSVVDVLDRLEKVIGRLADGTAPLEDLVAAHQQAVALLAEAEEQLKLLRAQAEDVGRQLNA
jgi:exodeoxyribonuclease VII small subunit